MKTSVTSITKDSGDTPGTVRGSHSTPGSSHDPTLDNRVVYRPLRHPPPPSPSSGVPSVHSVGTPTSPSPPVGKWLFRTPEPPPSRTPEDSGAVTEGAREHSTSTTRQWAPDGGWGYTQGVLHLPPDTVTVPISEFTFIHRIWLRL